MSPSGISTRDSIADAVVGDGVRSGDPCPPRRWQWELRTGGRQCPSGPGGRWALPWGCSTTTLSLTPPSSDDRDRRRTPIRSGNDGRRRGRWTGRGGGDPVLRCPRHRVSPRARPTSIRDGHLDIVGWPDDFAGIDLFLGRRPGSASPGRPRMPTWPLMGSPSPTLTRTGGIDVAASDAVSDQALMIDPAMEPAASSRRSRSRRGVADPHGTRGRRHRRGRAS